MCICICAYVYVPQVRTNCLDCLNRSNMAQTAIGLHGLAARLGELFAACAVPAVEGLLGTAERGGLPKKGAPHRTSSAP